MDNGENQEEAGAERTVEGGHVAFMVDTQVRREYAAREEMIGAVHLKMDDAGDVSACVDEKCYALGQGEEMFQGMSSFITGILEQPEGPGSEE